MTAAAPQFLAVDIASVERRDGRLTGALSGTDVGLLVGDEVGAGEETVLQVVREHGFSTNRGARGLSKGLWALLRALTLPAKSRFLPTVGMTLERRLGEGWREEGS